MAEINGPILGIETSCDETAAAVVVDGRRVLSNVVASQAEIHAQYGGVFPEIASRQHTLYILPTVEQALAEAAVIPEALGGVAAVYGPGLPGSLVVGVNFAKGLAMAADLPFVGINHLEAHIYTVWTLEEGRELIKFPLLALIASGGHTLLVLMRNHGEYETVGETLDDAAGEAFDKVARLSGLGYPGGPAIQAAAEGGAATAAELPRAWLPGTYDFSFSGLKTAALRLLAGDDPGKLVRAEVDASYWEEESPLPLSDFAASFQAAVVEVLAEKAAQAAVEHGARVLVLTGGVAANLALRDEIRTRTALPVIYPPPALCTDNGVGVAAAGWYRLQRGERSGWDLDVVSRARLGDPIA